jgi:hypothetical protein
MNSYKGDIIEESLINKEILKELNIISKRVEKVIDKHQTPWLTQWTLDTIEVHVNEAERLAEKLSKTLDPEHVWFIDYRNKKYHFVIFKDNVFKLNRDKKSDYDEMIKYGLSVGIPDYQLPNFVDLPIDVLDTFLREANSNTYANENVKKASPLRPGSHDYHFEKGDLTFHDTYFGATKFIGEEICYKNDKPVWGMNYYGFTLNGEISEGLFDAILRPALILDSGDNIPVRGPKEFINGEWKYTFNAEGDLSNFTGLEEISHNEEVVCRLYCHGGFIE